MGELVAVPPLLGHFRLREFARILICKIICYLCLSISSLYLANILSFVAALRFCFAYWEGRASCALRVHFVRGGKTKHLSCRVVLGE